MFNIEVVMLIGCLLQIIIMLWTFIFDVISDENLSKITDEKILVNKLSIQSLSLDQIECHEVCSTDYCYKYSSLNKNCTKFIRDQCDCCTVCLRKENEICGGRFNVYGLCEQDLLCYKSNQTRKNLYETTGYCVKGFSYRFYIMM